jgi:hypothetical protein
MHPDPLYDAHRSPTDLNLVLRGVLVAVVVAVLGALAVSNPTPWSPLGQAGQDERRPASSQVAEGQRTT